jgi:hypothetical protein
VMKTQGGEGEYKACASRGYLPYRGFYTVVRIDIVCLKRFECVECGLRSRGVGGGGSSHVRVMVTSLSVMVG